MSSYTDERVVEMRFDNKKFETNVAQSIRTIDKLKAKLNFKNTGKGLEALTDSAKKVDFSAIEDSVHKVAQSFNLLDAIHLKIIDQMSTRVVEFGKKQLKALSLDQAVAGWNKYESKASSVQTIINSTGFSIEKVNGYLDKLMWYSDETSYSFADMTSALSTMLAAGGDINKLIPMIMGIANATSYAGKGSAEFNRVLYNLNQSYSQGFLSLMDWKSVQNANVNSKALVETLIETGEALGKIRKGEVTAMNFTSSLAKKWADTEVMEEGFRKFAEATEEAYAMVERGEVSTASEAYDILSRKMKGIGITAAKSAQEAKTFGEAIASVKDAVATKFMTIFEYVFGNYQEAKGTWTNLANDLWEIFAGPFEDVQEMSGFDKITRGAEAVGIKMGDLKQKLIDVAIAEGVLTKEQVEASDVFADTADKAWITQDLYSKAIDSIVGSQKKTTDGLKENWTEWQNLMYKEWCEETGVALEDLADWQLNSLRITREEASEYGKASAELLEYADAVKEASDENKELFDSVNDPGTYKMGYSTMFKKAFNDYAWTGINKDLEDAGLALEDFGDILAEVGIESEKVTQQMIDESGGLVKSFESGWLDRDTYITALDKFAQQQKDAASEVEAGMTANQKYWYNKLVIEQGKTVDKMAQWELNAIGINGQQLIEYNARIKQIDDYIQLVKDGATATNEMFNGLTYRSGQSMVAQSIKNLSDALGSLKSLFSNVFDAIFPATDEQKVAIIRNIAATIEKITSKMIISEDTIEAISKGAGRIREYVVFIWRALEPLRNAFWDAIKNGIDNVKAALPDIGKFLLGILDSAKSWLVENNRLSNAVNYIKELFEGLLSLAGKLLRRFRNGEITFDSLKESVITVYNTIKTKLAKLVSIIDPDGKLEGLLSLLSEKFQTVKNVLNDIRAQKFESIERFLKDTFSKGSSMKTTVFENISKWAEKAKTIASDAFEAISQTVSSTYTWVVETARTIGNSIKEFVGGIDVGKLLTVIKSLAQVATLVYLFYNIGRFAKGLADVVNSIMAPFNNLAKGIKAIGTGIEFAGLALMIYSIGKTFQLLESFDFRKDWDALLVVVAMLAAMVGIVALINKVNKKAKGTETEDNSGPMFKAVLSIVGIAAAVLMMAGALKLIMEAIGNDPNALWPALAIISVAMIVTSTAIGIVGKSFRNVDTKGLAAALIAIPVSVGMLIAIVGTVAYFINYLINNFSTSLLISSLAAVVVIVAGVWGIVKAVQTLGKAKINGYGVAATLLSIGGVMLALAYVVKIMAKALEKNPYATIGAFLLIALGIWGILKLLQGFTKKTTVTLKAAGTILALGVVVIELAAVLSIMSLLNTEKLIGSAMAMFIVLGGIALVLGSISKIGKTVKISALFWMIAAVGVITTGLIALNASFDSALDALELAGTVLLTMAGMAGMMLILSKITRKFKVSAILSVLGAFVVIAATLAIINNYVSDIGKFALIGLTLAGTLVAVALSMKLVSTITKGIDWKGILGALAALVVVGISLGLVVAALNRASSVDIKRIAPAIAVLAGGLVLLAGVGFLLGKVPQALAGVAVAIVALVGVAGSFWIMAEAFDIFSKAAVDLIDALPKVGTNIKALSDNLQGTNWEQLEKLISLAGSAFLPLIGLGVAAGVMNLAITGLGAKLASLAIGVDALLTSIGLGQNLGPEFAKSIMDSFSYLEYGTNAVMTDEKNLIEGYDYSGMADAAKAGTTAVGSAMLAGMSPDNLDTSSLSNFKVSWIELLSSAFGVDLKDVYQVVNPGGAFTAELGSALYEMFANGPDQGYTFDLMDAIRDRFKGSTFKYTYQDWAEVLGIDTGEMIKIIDFANRKAVSEGNDIWSQLFMDPTLLSDDFNLDIHDYNTMITLLIREYLAAQEAPSENDPEIESLAEQVGEEATTAAIESAMDGTASGIEAALQKDSEEAIRAAVIQAMAVNGGTLTEDQIASIVAEEVGKPFSSSRIGSKVIELLQKNQPTTIDLTGSSSAIGTLIYKMFNGGGVDASDIEAIASKLTEDNFNTIPEGIRNAITKFTGTEGASIAEIIASVKGMTKDDWMNLVTNYVQDEGGFDLTSMLKDALGQFFGDGAEVDLGALFGANMTGTFADNLPDDYFAGTAEKFSSEADICVEAFTSALNSDASAAKYLEAANTIANSLSQPINEQLSPSVMSSTASDAMRAYGTSIQSNGVVATNAAKTVGNNVKNNLGSYSNGYSVGSNIISGLRAGLLNNDLTSVCAQIAHNMVNQFESVLKINSPSRVFKEIGGYTMQGFTIGIMDEETNVLYSIDDLANQAIVHMASAVTTLNEMVADAIDDQPVIKPLMDLTDIQDGTRQLSALVNTDSAARIQSSRAPEAGTTNATTQNGGSVVNYTQNNYSPRSLSRIEIYRQTKNQLSMISI